METQEIKSESRKYLTLEDRFKIGRLLAEGRNLTEIASIMNKYRPSISREVNKNGGRENYNPIEAHNRATENLGGRLTKLKSKQKKIDLEMRLQNLEFQMEILLETIGAKK